MQQSPDARAIEAPLSKAAELFRRGRLADAEAAARSVLDQSPGNPQVLHLLGLIRRQRGDAAGALPLLEHSVRLLPGHAEFRTNLGNLYRSLGRLRDAEAEYRAALGSDPQFRNARLSLARLLNDAGFPREAEQEARVLVERHPLDGEAWCALGVAQSKQDAAELAEASFRRSLDLAPGYAAAHHNFGALLSKLQRAEEALVHLDRAKGLGLHAAQLSYNRARALFDLYRLDEAETELSDAVSRAPGYVNAHVFLAKLRFMRGQEDFARSFRSARAAGHGGLALALAHGDLLRRSGDLPGAEDVLRGLLGQPDPARTVQAALSVVLQEQERLPEALAMAQEALVARPDDAIRVENLVAILLSLGRASEALPHIRNRLQSAGHDQRWLTYEATAARVLGLPEYEYLFDIARFVHKFALEPPPGWSSIEEFNADLLAVLQTRHRFVNAPLDQSLRAGSQTARSLLSDPDPVVRAFLTTLAAPLREYCARLGSDPAHPFVSRNVGATQLTGCWSVRLGRSGHHVNHIHPMGWVSSAYYVQVPDEVEDAERHGGWIKFGEPRYPVPGIGPQAYVKPEVGHLVLFPSYLWHGTVPIESGQPRITVAFDAVPDPGAASGGLR